MALDRVLALVSLVLAVVCGYESHRLWAGWGGAGLMPAFAAVHFLALATTFLFWPEGVRVTLPTRTELRLIVVVAASFAVYVAAIDAVGYLLSTWAFLSVVIRYTSRASARVAVVWPGFLAVGSYLLFSKGLGTHLPTGVLGF